MNTTLPEDFVTDLEDALRERDWLRVERIGDALSAAARTMRSRQDDEAPWVLFGADFAD